MKKRISVGLAWFLVGVAALAFFLPWVRPVAFQKGSSPLQVANLLAMDDDNIFDAWIGMRKEEWKVFAERPTVGLSGFQLLLLESEKSLPAAEARAWLDSVFGDQRAMGRMVIVIPLVVMLLIAAFLSPRKPVRQAFGVGGVLLLLFYFWARWRLDVTYTQRLLSQMEICYGLWITLYAMLAQAILVGLRFVNPKAKW